MSSQNSPNKDDSTSTSMYNSALDTLSFTSKTDSDADSVINDITLTEDNQNAFGSPDQLTSTSFTPPNDDDDDVNGTDDQLARRIRIYSTIEEFDQNLPETVTLLRTPFGSKVYLVGTAHFSRESQDDVSLVIRNVKPDVVTVELCSARTHLLKHDEKWLLKEARDINFAKIRDVIKSDGLVNGIFYILLLNMSAKLTKELGMAPGGEFRRAFEEMNRISYCMLQLGDRPINITLQRALHKLSLWQTIKIAWKLLTSNEKISKEEVEQCKQKDLLEEIMQEMSEEYPAFRDVFVTERDMYLCWSLQVAAQPISQQQQQSQSSPTSTNNGPTQLIQKPVNVVGVVGIGHSMGIVKHWGKVDYSKIEEILTIPPVSRSKRICKYAIKYSLLGLVGYGIFRCVRPRLPQIL